MRAARFALAILLLPAASAVQAQQQVAVSAELVIAAPTGNGTRNLSFGAVAPVAGQTVLVDVPAARTPISGTRYAGEFSFNVSGSRGLDFSVAVPVELTFGSNPTLGMNSNSTQYGGHCWTVNGSACALTSFNPSAGPVRVCHTMLGNGSCHNNRFFSTGSELYVYIGSMLTVPPTAMPGTYTGTITLTIVQVY
ncbi:MAG TPA: DUF4402 domain-containing protein [Longimicrobiales bacterium]|nr:DUF4402 domain-containing protein [Longimicrobiales bacterium]